MYDTVAQYGQLVSGHVDDWHPPIMVRLWQLILPLGPGTAPMFVLQAAAYAAGFALIVAALARNGRWRAATAATILAVSPLLLGWQMVVLKDAQMMAALVVAVGIIAFYRLSGRELPILAAVGASLLIGYATLVRANALFATVPLTVLLLPTRGRALISLVLAIAGLALVLALAPIVNHRLLRAGATKVANTEPLFDLAAIAVDTGPSAHSLFTPTERRELVNRHCVKAYFWDPLGDPGGCASATNRVMMMPVGELYRELAVSVALHPVAYARHRLAHWNSTERWLVQPGLPDDAPPVEAEPNNLGLGSPTSDFASSWQDVAAIEAGTPFGWPIVWTVLALLLVLPAWRRRAYPAGSLALALVASSLALEASFLVISIGSDLRYHLWPMAASALALILLSGDLRLPRERWILVGVVMALVIGAGLVFRGSLPPAPETYDDMVHAASG